MARAYRRPDKQPLHAHGRPNWYSIRPAVEFDTILRNLGKIPVCRHLLTACFCLFPDSIHDRGLLMPTVNQLVRKPRRSKNKKEKAPALRYLVQLAQEPHAQRLRLSAEARRVRPGAHPDPQEAQLRSQKGRQGASHQPDGGHRLHPRRRPQPPGALRSPHQGRASQRPARRPIPRSPRRARHRGRDRPKARPQQVRRKEGPGSPFN